MTIQFNLLPDIKIQYLKAKRQKHLVMLGSIAAIIVALAVFVTLITVVYGLQKKNIKDLNTDITAASNELKATKDLNKILTVQNQLRVLPTLHDQKVVSSRLYEYLSQVTPVDASIAKLNIDFELSTMTIAGTVTNVPSTLSVVNTYVDTLKFTDYTTKNVKQAKRAFSDVVLASFTKDATSTSYNITLKFDPLIFNGTEDVELKVPQIISTRSEVDKPTALFQGTGEGQ
jgi:hypothetical protein